MGRCCGDPRGVRWTEGLLGSVPVSIKFLLSRCEAEARAAADWRAVSTADAPDTGKQLDDHHEPETNGRMAVCRRCGSRTDSPAGRHHNPAEHQVPRLCEWLVAQARITRIDKIREARGG